MTADTHASVYDALAYVRELPEAIQKDLPTLIVNRKGNTPDAFMRTENFVGHVTPGETYTLGMDGFTPAADAVVLALPEAVTPPHCILQGEWNETVDLTIDDANILGGNGRYTLPAEERVLNIPVADTTAEHLAFYGSQLVAIGDATVFEANADLPVTITTVGKDYAEEYLLDAEKGGGAYLEVHDRPHFHMPMDETAAGYLIIGKRDDAGKQYVSAFQIPFGYGVHMAPWAIHADAYLTGRYMVIYSATPSFSTVIVRQQSGELAKITFG